MSDYLDRRLRSLEALLDELVERMRALPFTDKRRIAIVQKIREIEAEIDARQPL